MSSIRSRLASEGGKTSDWPGAAKLRILLIGSGGREHALTWRLEQSDLVDQIFVAPGNGGTALGLKTVNVNVPIDAFDDLADFATGANVNLVVVGPEQPLVDGIEGVFRRLGIPVFGPSQRAAAMEGSKALSKDFMKRHSIPTARYETFTTFEAARDYVQANPNQRVVLKASGLAAGKGVLLPQTVEEAVAGLNDLMVKREFGSAADEVVIEDFLEGEELSVLAFCDGYTILPLPAAQDHKAIGEGDTGPNTGGMGAYTPAPLATPALNETIMRTILRPTINGMRRDGFPFVGMLFTGIMVGPDGVPRTLEYNVRFGDPETQALLALLAPETDLAAVLLAAAERRLDCVNLAVRPGAAISVVLASAGYPGKYDKGKPITVGALPEGVNVFHAGTDGRDGKILTAGGRVMTVVAYGETLERAVALAYEGVKAVSFEGIIFRRDIAHRALNRRAPASAGLTYAAAGVDVDAGNDLVERIKPLVRATRRPGADADLGGFGGLFDLKAAGYRDPILVSGTDGVGTKLKVAQAVDKHDTIGIDLVAMSVNDLIVQGAEPLYFLDYFACGKLDVATAADAVKGVAAACRDAGCALIGGETAEMPSLYAGADYDMAGFAVGAVERAEVLPRLDDVRAGDVLLGLASSGLHSNGFSLVRKVLERASLSYDAACPWDPAAASVGHALLEPTFVYVRQLLHVLRAASGSQRIKALCHITGGGFTENIPRVLPASVGAEIDAGAWPLPPVFDWVMRNGDVAALEMSRTFNCGIGMVVVVAPEHAESLKRDLAAFEGGAGVHAIGRLVDGRGVTMRNLEAWARK